MSQSYIYLRKRLVKESIILAVVVAVLALLAFLVENHADDALSEQHGIENEVNAQQVKLTEMRQEYSIGQEQISMYEKFSKSHNNDFNLNRENANKWLTAQREIFHLVNMTITIPPFTDVGKETFSLKSGVMIKSDIKITFGALTDNSVFAFISALQREMPGVVVLQDIKLTKVADMSGNVLLDLNKHHITPMVNAEIAFSWFGIRNEVKGANGK